MDDLLKPAGIVRKLKTDTEPDFLREHGTEEKPKPIHKASSSLEDALETLRHEPDYDSLISVLTFLSRHEPPGSNYPAVKLPSPTSAQLVQVLVSDIVPNYWTLLSEDTHEGKNSGLKLLLFCLSSIAGVNAILVRLRALTQDAKSAVADKARRPDVSLNLGILLDLLSRVLQGDGWLLEAWLAATSGSDAPARVRPRVHELVAVFGSGRVISQAAEAEDIVRASRSGKQAENIWPADAAQYTQWLGRNIVKLALSGQSSDATKFASDLLNKALRLGPPDRIIQQLITELVLKEGVEPSKFGALLGHLPQIEQRRVLFSLLKLLSAEHLDHLGRCNAEESKPLISAVAGALAKLLVTDGSGKDHLVEWLTASSEAGLGAGVGIRRAAMAVLSQSKDHLVTVLEKSLHQFGDQLYIKHSPMLQQEVHAQVLLLSAGYVHRKSPIKLAMLLRSSTWLNAISNRLSAPHQRARFLGMVVGEALSSLVDKGDKRLNFKMEETDQEEGRWYKGLIDIEDEIGSVELLIAPIRPDKPQKNRDIPQKPVKRPPPQPSQTGFIVEELSDEELPGDDNDIVPYAKPDSDAEDSDDDATLVRRDKPKAPVYIRDLIRYLRDTESYDHQKLALATAPTLIRRKADYGTEVSEHAEELASLLVGLSDKFEIDNFDDLRTQGMIAIVVAKPGSMGPWFAKTFFDGDYSISQRASILVVLSLSARELAGVESSEYTAAAAFPSKTLPERVEKLYLEQNPSHDSSSTLKPLPHNALDTIATSLTSAFLAPLAATAADAATGPDVLKLSTFTSRLAGANDDAPPAPDTTNPKIKYKSSRPARPRVRSIPNTTAHLLATSFFAPLAARFPLALHHHPSLLALYLQTLALLLHAAGPSTLALPQMTAELWRLLLAPRVRALAVGDLAVTRALLVGFVALLDVNEDRMREVCVELGREVVEAQEWVAGVFGGLRGGDEGGEEEGVRMLAAGVLVRLREGIEKWRLVLVGDLIGFG